MINKFKKYRQTIVDCVPDQSRETRLSRLQQGRCPLHDKPLLQSDIWYRPKNGKIFTFVSCMHPKCKVEAYCPNDYSSFTLVPSWKFLLEQDKQGSALVYTIKGKQQC